MIDDLCILLSLGAVLWVLVRAAAWDPRRTWVERLSSRSAKDARPPDPWGPSS